MSGMSGCPGDPDHPEPTMSDLQKAMAGMPTVMELLGPPFSLIACILIGLMIFSLKSQTSWWRYTFCRAKSSRQPEPKIGWSSTKLHLESDFSPQGSANNSETQTVTSLCNCTEKAIADELQRFQNRPLSLLLLSLPAVASLAFCPVALFMHKPIVEFFWPYTDFPTAPNVNDAVSSFLVPAGLIYAIAFGFAYQEAVARQLAVVVTVKARHGVMEQILTLSGMCDVLSTEKKRNINIFLKEELFLWILTFLRGQKQASREESFSKRAARYRMVLTQLSGAGALQTCEVTNVDVAIKARVFDLIIELNKMTSLAPIHTASSMNILQWAFLESLGFFAFFGILLLEGESYRLELTMCMLTVFSISLFTFVLADLDQPFHGVFRIDLGILSQFLNVLESQWLTLAPIETPPPSEAT